MRLGLLVTATAVVSWLLFWDRWDLRHSSQGRSQRVAVGESQFFGQLASAA